MLTKEKYKEMGYTVKGEAVLDREGVAYYPKKAKSPQKAIKLFCRECQGMDRRERSQIVNVELVRDCCDPMCPLFDFRLGKNPFYKSTMTEEQRKAASERMSLLHKRDNGLDGSDQDNRQAVNP